MHLQKLIVRPVLKSEEARFRDLMQRHHYLGFVPKMGQTLWYVGCIGDQWTSLLGFSVAALKCKARDNWIGWDHRLQYGRLKLIANNNRFLILPNWHIRNLGSRTLAFCLKRIGDDWIKFFGYRIVLDETIPHAEKVFSIFEPHTEQYV